MNVRAYRQTARADAVIETRRRIVRAFSDYAQTRWFDDITLEEVASRAGVTVRTVIRQFGGKEGLVAAMSDRPNPPGNASVVTTALDIDMALDEILGFHEERGDATLRALAQELRRPVLSAALASDRAAHMAGVATTFSPWLARFAPHERQAVLDALIIATDVYAWKRLRRDMGRTQGETRAVVRAMVKSILEQTPQASAA
jgi:AcrR family transcriptional regulator